MAQFQIALLTPVFDKGINNKYLYQTISNFTDQLQPKIENINQHFLLNKSFCYSFDEQLTIHKNVEKELTFSMLQKNFNEFFEWVENPFTNTLQVGNLLLLTDRYLKTYLFIVKNISYKFLEHNIEYKYTCQDFFTYHFSRVGNGYVIANDLNTSNFIGSKTIDWWVNKIHIDCNIDYNYIPTSTGLYVYKQIIESNEQIGIDYFTSEDELYNLSENRTLIQILKHVDSSLATQDMFPFAVSNSNAKAALIAAVDQIGYMLNAYEFWDTETSTLKSFYWVEPQKNDRYTGLTYSPFNDIQDFSLSLSGDSLTTVLNVDSITKDDEEITLIPELSPLFADYISSPEWINSKHQEGMFTNILNGITNKWAWAKDLDLNNSPVHFNYTNTPIYAPIVSQLSTPNDENQFVWYDKSYYKSLFQTQDSTYSAITNISGSQLDMTGWTFINDEKYTQIPSFYMNTSKTISYEFEPPETTFEFNIQLPKEEPIEGISLTNDEKTSILKEENDICLFTAVALSDDKLYTMYLIWSPKLKYFYWAKKDKQNISTTVTEFPSNALSKISIKCYNTSTDFQCVVPINTNKNLSFVNNLSPCTQLTFTFSTGISIRPSVVKLYQDKQTTVIDWLPVVNYQPNTNTWQELLLSYNRNTSNTVIWYGRDSNPIDRFSNYTFFATSTLQCKGIDNNTVINSIVVSIEYDFNLLDWVVITQDGHTCRLNKIYIEKWTIDSKNDSIIDKWFKKQASYKSLSNVVKYWTPVSELDVSKDTIYGGVIKLELLEPYKILPYYNFLNYTDDSYLKLQKDEQNISILHMDRLQWYYKNNDELLSTECESLSYNESIDLGFIPTNTMRSILVFKYDSNSVTGSRFYGGSNNDNNDYRFFLYRHPETKQIFTYWDINGDSASTNPRIAEQLIPCNTKVSVELGNYYLKYNNIMYELSRTDVTFNDTMKLFHPNDYGTFYELQVYDFDINANCEILIHHFVPYQSYHNDTLKIGLYDKVENKFIEVPGAIVEPKSTYIQLQTPISHLAKNYNGHLVGEYVVESSDIVNYVPTEYNITLKQYSIVSEEDEQFARIADKCPWLENILINFQYFLNNKVLDNTEYNNLLQIFKNKLRIVNGQLLFYSKEYFNALRQKTQIISSLFSKMDNLGAWVQQNIIDAFQNLGTIEPRNDFQKIYNDTMINSTIGLNKYPLLNFDETISEYFTKYFQSQQRFLKNIYQFNNYFNQISPYSNLVQNKYVLQMDPVNTISKQILNLTWERNIWQPYNTKTTEPWLVAKLFNNQYERIYVVDNTNVGQFYIPNNVQYNQATILDNRQYYIAQNQTYVPVTHEQIFYQYLKYLKNKNELENYYYQDTNTYTELITPSQGFDSPQSQSPYFAVPQLLFNDFFKTSKINANLHNNWLLADNYDLTTTAGKNNLARCYITNLPLPTLYCKVKNDKEIIQYEPIQYAYNTWDSIINPEVFTDSPTFSTLNNIINMAQNSANNSNYYRLTNDSEATVKFDLSSTPTLCLNGQSLIIDKSSQRFSNSMCDYWKFSNIEHANLEDCEEAIFTSTADWAADFNFNKFSKGYDDKAPMSMSDYQTYFSKIITTYNYKGCKRYFKNLYWRFINDKEILHKGQIYYKLNWDKIANTFNMMLAPNKLKQNRISSIEFYFLKEYMEEVIVNDDISVQQYLNNVTWEDWGEQGASYYISNTDVCSLFIPEAFEIGEITLFDENNILESNINSNVKLYDKISHKILNWTEDTIFLSNYFYKNIQNYIEAEEFNENGEYYYKNIEEQFIPAYTITTIQKQNNIYYLQSPEKTYSTWQNAENINLYPLLQTITIDDNNIISVKYENSPIPVVLRASQNNLNNQLISINYNNQNYTGRLKVELNTSTPFFNMTNGEFWYQNHNFTDDAVLFEEAASIETQLTSYWSVAYNASLNCEYIIPEHWQPTVNGKTNYFKNVLYNNDKGLRLNPHFIPNINVLQAPGYEFHYSSNSIVPNQAISMSMVQSNIAIYNALSYINKNKQLFNNENWYLISNQNTMNYYYVDDNSGMEWSNFPNYILKTSPLYSELSGNYIMLIRYLLTNYQQRTSVKYEELKKEQQAIWYSLLQQYSNLILQNNFTPTDALNSDDVWLLANNALKDLSQTERQYNITLLENKISHFKLNNYQLQELHIGDPIAIKADNYYHQYDNIYNILKSYLFITDISYKLREDSSLKLTVNNLKYQDKLIQSLVKLIR